MQLVEVEPKLRFGDENHIVFPVFEVAIAPHVGKTAERHGTGGEVAIPRARELPGIGLRLLGQVLVHGRNREAGLVRRGVPSVGHADEIGIVVAEFVAQPAIVLNVGGEGRFAQRKLARDLPVGRFHTLVGVVHVDEIERVAPTVGTKLFDRGGPTWARGLVFGVELTTEVVVQLDVLGLCRAREGGEQHEEQEHESGAHGEMENK